jgi:hypothetical protein
VLGPLSVEGRTPVLIEMTEVFELLSIVLTA